MQKGGQQKQNGSIEQRAGTFFALVLCLIGALAGTKRVLCHNLSAKLCARVVCCLWHVYLIVGRHSNSIWLDHQCRSRKQPSGECECGQLIVVMQKCARAHRGINDNVASVRVHTAQQQRDRSNERESSERAPDDKGKHEQNGGPRTNH